MEQMGDDLRSGTMETRRGASMRQIKQTHLATRTRIGLEQQLAHRNQKADVTHFWRDILLPPKRRLMNWVESIPLIMRVTKNKNKIEILRATSSTH